MNPDQFDEMIRDLDPGDDSSRLGTDDPVLSQSLQQWTELSTRRVVLRTRVSICVAALGVFALVGASALWIGVDAWKDDRQFAVTPSETDQGLNVGMHTEVETGDSRNVASSESPPTLSPPTLSPPTLGPPQISRSAAGDSRTKDNPGESADALANARPNTPAGDLKQRLDEFALFIEQAGPVDSDSWNAAQKYLANQSALTQRAAINFVPKLDDDRQRIRAFDLVCAAAGNSVRSVLAQWLADPLVRPMAWERLVGTESLRHLTEMIPAAQNEHERLQLCHQIASLPSFNSVSVLLSLTREPLWRAAVRSSTTDLHASHIRSLIMLMRERNADLRTAAAFVLASVPGDYVDQVVASMIVGGRFRQPAYLVLLSRDTPQARAFLAQAATRPELTPALVSARMHFATIQPQLQQWIAESKGANHERSDTSQRLLPKFIGVGDRCANVGLRRPAIG